jgi:Protein of unknown function (DUF2442)
MNTLANNATAKGVRFAEDTMSVIFSDGRELSVPLAYFPRLLKATPQQRLQFTMSGGGIGIHWEELDEDISVINLLLGFGDTTKQSGFVKKYEAA